MSQLLDLSALSAPVNGVHLVDAEPEFATHYAAVRTKEKRILTDAQVRKLPDGNDLWNASEWHMRSASAVRLLSALKSQGEALRILDVGCGNGWLSNALYCDGHQVIGIDPFTIELEQAARVFPEGPVFARVDLFNKMLPKGEFDAIIFAASIHYFNDLKATLERSFELLRTKGNVHVIDTKIYADRDAAAAAHRRTQAYFTEAGVQEMILNYHAYSKQEFAAIGPFQILDEPTTLDRMKQLLSRQKASPFTHLIYRKP